MHRPSWDLVRIAHNRCTLMPNFTLVSEGAGNGYSIIGQVWGSRSHNGDTNVTLIQVKFDPEDHTLGSPSMLYFFLITEWVSLELPDIQNSVNYAVSRPVGATGCTDEGDGGARHKNTVHSSQSVKVVHVEVLKISTNSATIQSLLFVAIWPVLQKLSITWMSGW